MRRKAYFVFAGYLAILVDVASERVIREWDTPISGIIPTAALRWCERNNIETIEEPSK